MVRSIEVAPGTYDVYDTVAQTTTQVTVLPVTPGTIAEASPVAGDTLTVTGSTPDDDLCAYNWQVDGVDLDPAVTTITLPSAPEGDVRRGMSRGGAPMVYTPAVTVTAALTVPSAFVDADWSVATGSAAGEVDVTIASLPSDGGATITDVEYELDASGTWVSSGGTTDFTITGLTADTAYDVRLRAVNSVGNGAAGNSESATSGAGSWSPADITSLEAWYDADDVSTFTLSGSDVDEWRDKSGNAHHWSGTSTNAVKPPRVTGPAGVDFASGTATRLEIAQGSFGASVSVIGVWGGSSGETTGTFFTNTSGPADLLPIAISGGAQAGPWRPNISTPVFFRNGASVPAVDWDERNAIYQALFASGVSDDVVFFERIDMSSIELIGSRAAPNNDFRSRVAREIIIAAAPMSTSDRQKAEGYLAHKWGLEGNLPANHPYKAAPPAS